MFGIIIEKYFFCICNVVLYASSKESIFDQCVDRFFEFDENLYLSLMNCNKIFLQLGNEWQLLWEFVFSPNTSSLMSGNTKFFEKFNQIYIFNFV